MGSTVIALVLGSASNAGELGKYGAQKVYTLQHENLSVFDSQVYSTVIANAAQQMGSHTVIIRNNANGKAILRKAGGENESRCSEWCKQNTRGS